MSDHKPWEPDPQKLGNWQAMFEQRRGSEASVATPPNAMPEESFDDVDAPALDLREYKPWILQRGRGKSVLLDLRHYEPRSGLWQGWMIPTYSLIAVEYIDGQMVALDFGQRQFVIEGTGLDELTRRLQHGTVATIIEHCATLWPARPVGPIITRIRRIVASAD